MKYLLILVLAVCAIGGDTTSAPQFFRMPLTHMVPRDDDPKDNVFVIQTRRDNAFKPLIVIRADGTVEADSAILAVEAGRVFVESIRKNLKRPCADTGRKP